MNKISFYIEKIETQFSIQFKPNRDFYKRIGIGQKRFKKLRDNLIQPDLTELEDLAKYFHCKPEDLQDFKKVSISQFMQK